MNSNQKTPAWVIGALLATVVVVRLGDVLTHVDKQPATPEPLTGTFERDGIRIERPQQAIVQIGPDASVTAQADSRWQRFSPSGAGFTSLLPGTPTEQSATEQGVTMHGFGAHDGTAGYMVGYSETLTVDNDKPKLLDELRNDLTHRMGADSVKESLLCMPSQSGQLEAVGNGRQIEIAGAKGQLQARLILSNHRLYMAMVMAPQSTIPPADAKTFLCSFLLQPS